MGLKVVSVALMSRSDVGEPVDGVLVVVAEDGEVTLVEVASEPAAAAHRREGGDGARVVDQAGESLDGHRHDVAQLAVAEAAREAEMSKSKVKPNSMNALLYLLLCCSCVVLVVNRV